MHRALVCLVLCSLVVTGCAHEPLPPVASEQPHASRDQRGMRLALVESWAFAIGDGILDGTPEDVVARLSGIDLVVVDAEEADAETVAALRDSGAIVLGYLSVGTIEPWRPWYPELEQYRLRKMDDWDEYYADISKGGYRTSILGIAEELMGKGFDGLFLDNVDMIETLPMEADGMDSLVHRLGDLVHEDDGYLVAQNGWMVMGDMLDALDGWNREDVTWTYDFDTGMYQRVADRSHAEALSELAAAHRAGLLVLSTDYTDGSATANEECVTSAREIGALPYVSDIGLSRSP